jgi:pimeloyl-ACP methyl ester carboxylesterase
MCYYRFPAGKSMRSAIFLCSLALAGALAGGDVIPARCAMPTRIARPASSGPVNSDVSGESTKPSSPIIVIGFVGGFVRHDDLVHSGVQLAARLRDDYPSGVYINTFENHQGDQAYRAVLQLLDTDHDGAISAEEKRNARVVIYGHSWGGSQTVALAIQLNRDGIPVLLTIQVDSVEKSGEDDSVIPANVAQAINFYQSDGLLHGRPAIRAADPARTRILGNFRQDYAAKPIRCDAYPWWGRIFMKSHIEIECDPRVWKQVEALIRSKLPPPTRATSASSSPDRAPETVPRAGDVPPSF